MRKVIIFNAPPEAGKDIAAKATIEYLRRRVINATHCEFKEQIFKQVKLFYCLTDEQWDTLYTRENKETPTPLLDGKSPRQALIHMSENVTKPNFGDDYYGQAASKSHGEVLVFSDGGFVSELKPLIERFGVDNIAIIKIHREGCSYANDSRDYLPDGMVNHEYHIENFMPFDKPNDAEFEDFLIRIKHIAHNFYFG